MPKKVTNPPFMDGCDDQTITKCFRHRMKVVKKFIGKDIDPIITLDVGGSNKFSRALGIRHNTTGDLNAGFKRKDLFKTITCFEVLEHVMNPLYLMESIYRSLRKGGTCYLSTPIKNWAYFMQTPKHFTEYQPDRLRKMFEYAGFEVVKYRKFCVWDWEFMFWGIRPFFRVLLHRNQLWELKK